MNFIPENFKRSIALIGIDRDDPKWVGTGFLVSKKDNQNLQQIYLVTAKHVVANSNNYFACFPSERLNRCVYYDLPHSMIYSIQDERNLDIAVLKKDKNLLKDIIIEDTINLDNEALSISNFQQYGGQVGDTIKILGYPLDVLYPTIFEPVCRTGCVARINAQELQTQKVFLLDVLIFGGNSGSPVFTRINENGTKKTVVIGLVVSVYREQLFDEKNNHLSFTAPTGITAALPGEFIFETIESYETNFTHLYENYDEYKNDGMKF